MENQHHSQHVSPWNLVIHGVPGMADTGLFECLNDLGRVHRAAQGHVFLLHAADPVATLQHLRLLRRMNPAIDRAIERIVPLTETFTFASEQELCERANRCLEQWHTRLAGKSVHLDCAQDAAAHACAAPAPLGGILAGLLERAGLCDATDPDLYLTFDCCGDWAGLSLWSRGLCRRYPELGLDNAATAPA